MKSSSSNQSSLTGRTISRRQLLKRGAVALAAAPAYPYLLKTAASGYLPEPAPHWAVVTVRPESDAAALEILKKGGNAIDAAVAAMLAICIVQPASVGLGGYGGTMAIYLSKKRLVTSIDFDSRAPLEFRPELFAKPEAAEHGYLAVGVPGVVAGFDLALRKFGKLGWKAVAEPALRLAEEGVIVDQRLSKSLEAFAKQTDPASSQAYFPSGKPPELGQRWVQHDLAKVLREVSQGGAEAFYHGDIARTIVKQVREHGGILSEADFQKFKAQEAEPLHIAYRGYEIYTPPPPSGGVTSLSILKTLEQFELKQFEPWGAEYFHVFAETSKLTWAERFQHFGDPEVVDFSAKDFLSQSKAAERARQVTGHKVAAVVPPGPEPLHTANVLIVDSQRNIVSLTATHGGGFGSRVVIGGLGLVLGHGMSRFTLESGSPNFPAPGKRMQHNMSPAIILREGRPAYAIGLPGGRMIVTVTAQLAASLIDFKASATQAVHAPRLHTEGAEPLIISVGTPDTVAAGLEARGHQIKHGAVAGPANVAVFHDEGNNVDSDSGRGLVN